jgi:hypothetical protein
MPKCGCSEDAEWLKIDPEPWIDARGREIIRLVCNYVETTNGKPITPDEYRSNYVESRCEKMP